MAAVLGQLREVADEIVVAVDSRVDATGLGYHHRIADRLFRFEYSPPIERARPWLYGLCSRSWILEIDDDEVLSGPFLDELPDLIRDWRYQQHWLPCHWLFPDAHHWLDEPPWSFDSNRLFRNDPATLWAAGLSHTRADPVFPSRYHERGFYHLAYLLTDESQRREKVSHYLGIPEGHRIASTDRDIADLYVPESVEGTTPVIVPRRDRPAIEAVLEARGPALPTPAGVAVPLVTRSEIDASWPERTLGPRAYEAELEILDRVVRLAPCEHRPISVRVTNRGDETWPWSTSGDGWPYPSERRPQIRLSYRWLRRDGAIFTEEPFRTGLPATVQPGEATVVPVIVAAPDESGQFLLEIDLVHEHARWFGAPARTYASVGEQSGL